MRKGKLQQSVLVRSVFKMLGQKREDAAGPAVGRGVSAFGEEKGDAGVFVCAGAGEGSGGRGASRSAGCATVWPRRGIGKGVLVSLMLPEAMEERI